MKAPVKMREWDLGSSLKYCFDLFVFAKRQKEKNRKDKQNMKNNSRKQSCNRRLLTQYYYYSHVLKLK